MLVMAFFVVLVIAHFLSSPIKQWMPATRPDENTRQCGRASDWGEMAGINVWATQIKSLTRRLRRSPGRKEVEK